MYIYVCNLFSLFNTIKTLHGIRASYRFELTSFLLSKQAPLLIYFFPVLLLFFFLCSLNNHGHQRRAHSSLQQYGTF